MSAVAARRLRIGYGIAVKGEIGFLATVGSTRDFSPPQDPERADAVGIRTFELEGELTDRRPIGGCERRRRWRHDLRSEHPAG